MVEVDDESAATELAPPLRFNREREYSDGEDVLLVELSLNGIFASLLLLLLLLLSFFNVFVNQVAACR